jgi:squalene-hopene/tetraprenyl-beta-curcumene cyclase
MSYTNFDKTKIVDTLYIKFYTEYVNNLSIHPALKSFLTREEIFNKDSPYYLYYPKLFSKPFQVKEDKNFFLLCTAGFLYYQSLVNIDKSFDSKLKALSLSNFTIVLSCQEEAIKILSRLFNLHSHFWNLWSLRKQEYLKASEIEKSLSTKKESDFRNLSDLKSAFGKVAIDALYVLSKVKNKNKIHSQLLAAHKEFSWANQILDDLQDIEEDMDHNQPNVVHSLILKRTMNARIDNQPMSIAQLKKYLYLSGVAVELYKKVSRLYRNVRDNVSPLKLGLWNEILLGLESDTIGKIETIHGHFEIIKLRKQLGKSIPVQQVNVLSLTEEDSSNELLKSAYPPLNYILTEWGLGFPELKHIMYLGKTEGFQGKKGIHIGDIFQRALVADLLCDVKDKFPLGLEEVIQREVQYLISRKLKTPIGGWSYFPSVKEIAPDIDDLGQIIQLFIKSGNLHSYEKYCKGLIEIILRDCKDNNGGTKTWIIPKEGLSKLQEKQVFFNKTKWGEGPDVEVMANFLYSLTLVNKIEFSNYIVTSSKYIIKQQDSKGFWKSRWYYGNYYGTYTCIRLLKSISEINGVYKSLSKAEKYILDSQNIDGGWGTIEAKSDPLNSAIALISLHFLNNRNNKKYIKRGIDYLLKSKSENQTWQAVDFIRPRINEPYKSKTITNAYVLKALAINY